MKDYVKLIGMGKACIDQGFSRVGRSLAADDPAQKVLTRLASRSIALANAVALLSLNNHANEALPLLRSLFEISLHMRWIAAQDGAARAEQYLQEHANPDWETLWPSGRLRDRVKVLDYPQDLAEKILSSCRDHLEANAAGVPWGHVFAGESQAAAGMSPEDLMKTTALVMGHVVKALDLQWGQFAGAEEMWQAAYNVRGK